MWRPEGELRRVHWRRQAASSREVQSWAVARKEEGEGCWLIDAQYLRTAQGETEWKGPE